MFTQFIPVLQAYGPLGLVILAFAESSFFPVFPDFLLIPLCLANHERAPLYALLATLASAAGASFGYLLGKYIGKPILHRLASARTTERLEHAFQTYGAWAVLLAGLTPLPYKLFTISSGICAVHFPRFLAATLVGRGIRFFMEALLIMIAGQRGVGFIKHNFGEATIVLALIILIILLFTKKGREIVRPLHRYIKSKI
ncbi:MAG: VTT domain-containing protein [Syntrophomonas sp.]